MINTSDVVHRWPTVYYSPYVPVFCKKYNCRNFADYFCSFWIFQGFPWLFSTSFDISISNLQTVSWYWDLAQIVLLQENQWHNFWVSHMSYLEIRLISLASCNPKRQPVLVFVYLNTFSGKCFLKLAPSVSTVVTLKSGALPSTCPSLSGLESNFGHPMRPFKMAGEISRYMMTSSNRNIFRVTGHLCGEFTGPRWIPRTKASDAELWCFLWSALE